MTRPVRTTKTDARADFSLRIGLRNHESDVPVDVSFVESNSQLHMGQAALYTAQLANLASVSLPSLSRFHVQWRADIFSLFPSTRTARIPITDNAELSAMCT